MDNLKAQGLIGINVWFVILLWLAIKENFSKEVCA